MDFNIKFISKRWQHHSTHSGYDQLADSLGCVVGSPNLESILDKWIPGRIAIWLANRSGVKHYSDIALYDEFAAFRDLFFQRNKTIYHVLYGDDSYRYIGNFTHFLSAVLVATYHQPPAALKENLLNVQHLRHLDGLIVVGTNQIPFFEPILGREKIFFVPHGVDANFFHPEPVLASGEREGGVCLFVGRHKRDFLVLRQVIEMIGDQDKSIRFVLVIPEGRREQFLGLPNVDLCHKIPDIELVRLYQNADVLLQPMLDCTANNALLEGLACGLPVVATDIGAVRDYMDEDCGRLVPFGDAEAMTKACMELLSDKEARKKMAVSAREQALQFDWSIIVGRMLEVYSTLLT